MEPSSRGTIDERAEGSLGKLSGLSIALMLGLAAAFAYGQKAEIMANWAQRRCEPGVVVSASLYKPDDDPRSAAQFASDNFQFCRGKIAQDALKVASTPLRMLQDKQKDIVNTFYEKLGVIDKIKGKLSEIFNQIIESATKRFHSTFAELKNKFELLMNIVQRIMTSITAVFMSLIAVLVTFTTLIQFALYIIAIIVGILIALMVIFAAFIAPVSWLLFAGIAVIGIIAGAVAGVVIDSSFCLSPETRVILADGSIKEISFIRPGDILGEGCGTVTAAMDFHLPLLGGLSPLFEIHGVRMSGTHLVENNGIPVMAKDHPDAVPTTSSRILYNLNTTSRKIPVLGKNLKSLIVYDYEELGSEDAEALLAWREYVFQCLNPEFSSKNGNPMNIEAGIHPDLCVIKKDFGPTPISAIHLGDIIMTAEKKWTTVVGTVELLAEGSVISTGLSEGIWSWNGEIWDSGSQYDTIPLRSTTLMRHLFTESGHFIVDKYLVRDFSEIGLLALPSTYSFVSNRLSEKKPR